MRQRNTFSRLTGEREHALKGRVETIRQCVRIALPCILVLSTLAVSPSISAAPATGSIPVGQSAMQVLSTLTVGTKSNVSSDRKSHQWNKVDEKSGNYTNARPRDWNAT